MATRLFSTLRPSIRRALCPVSQRQLATSTTVDKASPVLPPPGKGRTSDPHILEIVHSISGLTLLQAADLVSTLKTHLNIQEVAAPVAAAPAAPAEVVEIPPEEKPKEKTVFTVRLDSIEASAKPKVIREVKALIPNLNLMDAKKFVESIPKPLKENLPKEEAEKLKATFESLGAKVTLE